MARWVVFSVLLLPALAGAGPSQAFVVGSGDCGDGELLDDAHALSSALKERMGARLLDEAQVREKLRPESSRSIDELHRQLEAAQVQFYQAEYRRAEAATNGALVDVERLPPGPERVKLWTQAQLLLAVLYRDTNRAEAADEAFRRVLRVEPEFQLDPDLFSPNTRSRFDRLRKDIASGRRVALEVRSTPVGADVFLDGVKFGRTPLSAQVPRGAYALSVVKDDAASFFRSVVLDAPVRLHVDLASEGAFRATRAPCLMDRGDEASRLLNVVKVASTLDADEVVVVRLERQQIGPAWLSAALLNVQTAQKVREGGLKLSSPTPPQDALSELATFIVTGQRAGRVETPPGSPPPAAEPSRTEPAPAPAALAQPQPVAEAPPPPVEVAAAPHGRWQRPAAYGLAGFGVLALGAGVVFELNASASRAELESYRLPSGSFDPDKKFEAAAARDRASMQQTVAWVGFGAGVAALAGGAALYLMTPKSAASDVAVSVSPRGVSVRVAF